MDIGLSPSSIIAGWLSSHIVEYAKKHPAIPLSPDNVKLIKTILRLAGSVLVLAVAYLDGRLSDGTATVQEGLLIVWELAQFLVASKLTFKAQIKGSDTPVISPPEPALVPEPKAPAPTPEVL